MIFTLWLCLHVVEVCIRSLSMPTSVSATTEVSRLVQSALFGKVSAAYRVADGGDNRTYDPNVTGT